MYYWLMATNGQYVAVGTSFFAVPRSETSSIAPAGV